MDPSFDIDRAPIPQERPAVIRQQPTDGDRDKGGLLFIPVRNVPVIFLDRQTELDDPPSVKTAKDGIARNASRQTEVIGTGHICRYISCGVLMIKHVAASVADFLSLTPGLPTRERLHFEGFQAHDRPLLPVLGLPGLRAQPAFEIHRASLA